MENSTNGLLPTDIHATWAEVLASLPPSWRSWGWELVQTYLPPMSVDALSFVDDRHTADKKGFRPAEQPWESLLNPDGTSLVKSVPKSLWVSHPLFMAIYRLFPDDIPGHYQARQLLVDQLVDLEAPEDALEAPAYYNDALALRQCLKALAQEGKLAILPAHPTLFDLIQALDGLPETALENGTLPEKIKTIRSLTQGKRFLGTRHHHQPNRSSTTRLPLRTLTRATPGSQAKKRGRPPKEQEDTGTGSSKIVIGGRQYKRHPPPGKHQEAADPDTPLELERTQPSALTPADDWLTLRRGGGMPPTAPVAALTDPAPLPNRLLFQALNVLSDTSSSSWALAWLVITTGMSPRRLATLAEADSTPAPDWALQWLAQDQLIRFRLRDGPARAEDPAEENQVVTLPVPDAIQEALAAEHSPYPLANAGKEAAKTLSKAFRQTSGPTPTLNRVRASAWAWIRPYAKDPVAAAMLGGQFAAGLAAQAAYRTLRTKEVAALFCSTNENLVTSITNGTEGVPSLKYRLARITFPVTVPDAIVGSNRSLPLETFERTLNQLRDAYVQAGNEARAAKGNRELEAPALQYLVNTQALYSYLGWLLATAARPIGPKTTFQPLSWAWFLSDKASARYQETRILPPIASVQYQLEQAVHDRYRVLRHLDLRGWSAKDNRSNPQKSLPAFLKNTRSRNFQVRTLCQPDFETWMSELGLAAFIPTPANTTRHTMATHLRGQLSASLVDAYLGHHGHGADRLGPASAVAVTAWDSLAKEVEEVLARVGFSPLKLSHVWS